MKKLNKIKYRQMIYDQDICKIRNIGIKHTGKKFGAYLF